MNGCPPTIYGDGTQSKDFHYIDDLIKAYSLIVDKWADLNLFGRAINFGTGRETSINELAGIIVSVVAEETGRDIEGTMEPVHLPKRPGEVMRFTADISLARKCLGFAPKIDIREGIARYVRWFTKEGSPAA
jgi:UDP-glucose 4-epimerase